MSAPTYRKEALAKLASPERLDHLMPLTNPRGWIALAAAGFLLLLVLLWGIFGTVTTRVHAQGALLRPGGITSVEAPQAGVVTRLLVQPGTDVREGEELLTLAPGVRGAEPVKVVSPCAAQVLDVAVMRGQSVEKGTELLVLEGLDQPLQAILYLPIKDGEKVEPGKEVQLTPGMGADSHGHALPGRVKSVGRLPARRAAMLRTLGSEELVNDVLRGGPCLEVVVELTLPPGEERYFDDLYSGKPCQGRITVRQQRPIQLVGW